MYRNMITTLVDWSEQEQKEILLLKGARGVGKTWCVMDFAEAFFKKAIHIDFSKDTVLREMFLMGNRPEFIDEQLELLTETDLHAEDTSGILMVYDGVQVAEDLFAGVMQYARQRRNLATIIIADWVGVLPA